MESMDYNSLFQFRITEVLAAFFEKNPESNLKIVLVPSLADAHHDHCYPQPPLADLVSGGVKSPFFPDEQLFTLGLGDASLREVRLVLLLRHASLCIHGSVVQCVLAGSRHRECSASRIRR